MYTIEQLQSMNSTDLRKAGTELGVKSSSKYKKDILLQMCINIVKKISTAEETQAAADDQPNAELNAETPKIGEWDMTSAEIVTEKGNLPTIVSEFDMEGDITLDEIAAIYHSKIIVRKNGAENKSEKFRMLHKEGKGLRIGDIAKLYGSPYSYVFGVIDRQRKAEKNGNS